VNLNDYISRTRFWIWKICVDHDRAGPAVLVDYRRFHRVLLELSIHRRKHDCTAGVIGVNPRKRAIVKTYPARTDVIAHLIEGGNL